MSCAHRGSPASADAAILWTPPKAATSPHRSACAAPPIRCAKLCTRGRILPYTPVLSTSDDEDDDVPERPMLALPRALPGDRRSGSTSPRRVLTLVNLAPPTSPPMCNEPDASPLAAECVATQCSRDVGGSPRDPDPAFSVRRSGSSFDPRASGSSSGSAFHSHSSISRRRRHPRASPLGLRLHGLVGAPHQDPPLHGQSGNHGGRLRLRAHMLTLRTGSNMTSPRMRFRASWTFDPPEHDALSTRP
jgi:hypothetical protein